MAAEDVAFADVDARGGGEGERKATASRGRACVDMAARDDRMGRRRGCGHADGCGGCRCGRAR